MSSEYAVSIGYRSIVLLVVQLLSYEKNITEVASNLRQLQENNRIKAAENESLRRQLDVYHTSMMEMDDKYQEKIDAIRFSLSEEREKTQILQNDLSMAQSKMEEMVRLWEASPNKIIQQLENTLSECYYRIAELESQRDELEMELRMIRKDTD